MQKQGNQLLVAYFYLFGAGVAAALWYIWPHLGVWPLLVGLAPWLVGLISNGRLVTRTPFDLPLLLFLVTAAIAVWSAFDLETAVAKFWVIVAAILLFYAFATWLQIMKQQKFAHLEQSAWLLALWGTAVALYFIASHNWDDFPTKVVFIEQIGRALQRPLPTLPGHRLHPNVVGGMLAALLPFGIVTAIVATRQRQRVVQALGLMTSAIMLVGLLFSSSRGAWLATLAALGLAFLWWITSYFTGSQASNRRWWWLSLLAAGALTALLATIILPEVATGLITRLLGGGDRLNLFRNSLILVQDYPFIGAGLGNFMMLYSTYALLTHVGFIIHAHNIYLDVAIEQGLIGLATLVWMWGLFAWLLWREAGRSQIQLALSWPKWPLLAAAALSLLTILLHGLVEDALYGSRALILMFIPLAFVMVLPPEETKKAQSWRMGAPVALGALLLLIGVVGLRPLRSYAFSNLATIQQSHAELSVYSWPEWPIQDEVRRNIDLSAATTNYQQALTLNPHNAAANRRLGQLQLSLGQYESAQAHLASAFATTPWDNATRQLYGEALIVNGRIDEGAALWQTVPTAQGQLDARTFWYQHIGDNDRVTAVDTWNTN